MLRTKIWARELWVRIRRMRSSRKTLRAKVVMDREPVLRLRIDKPLKGGVGGAHRRRAREQRAGECRKHAGA